MIKEDNIKYDGFSIGWELSTDTGFFNERIVCRDGDLFGILSFMAQT
jgi:hypothetical protein